MSHLRVPAVVSAVVMLALPGCDLLDFTVDVPEVCQDIGAIEVQGLPGVPEGEIARTFDVDLAGSLKKAGIDLSKIDGDLSLTRISLWPSAGISDFGFATQASIVLQSTDTSLPEVTVAEYARGTQAAAARVDVTPATAINLLPYARVGSVHIEASFVGNPPDSKWTLGGEVCVRAKTTYSLK